MTAVKSFNQRVNGDYIISNGTQYDKTGPSCPHLNITDCWIDARKVH